MSLLNEPADQNAEEISRIQLEYSRRGKDLPLGYYGWGKPENLFFHQQVVREAIRSLTKVGRFPLNGLRLADIGCGNGAWLLEYMQWGASPDHIAGIDAQPGRIAAAKDRVPAADLHTGDARFLPWPDSSFDLVSQHTLFTSILDSDVKQSIAKEMIRVLKPEGVVLWYDFRFSNPKNSNVRGIGAAEVRSLFPTCSVALSSITLAPPIARRVVKISWLLALGLEKIPFLKTHYLGVIRKR